MSSIKKTLFWIIILISLSGTFYFFDQQQESAQRAKEASLRLFPFNVQDITEFWITNNNEKLELRATRDPGGWRLTQPLLVDGDNSAIEKFLTNIVTARRDAVLFAQAEVSKMGELGLDSPEIEMGMKAGGEEIVLIFGDKGPTHNVAYLMIQGKPDVYRVHSDVKREANKDVYALRDKTILDIDPPKLRRLEIEQMGASRIVVEHHQGKWTMLEPTPGMAVMEKVLESLYEIKNSQVKAFVDETPADLNAYGLAYPLLKMTIYEDGKKNPQILTIGSKDRVRRGYFSKTDRAENIFDVEEEMVNNILQNIDKLLDVDSGVAG